MSAEVVSWIIYLLIGLIAGYLASVVVKGRGLGVIGDISSVSLKPYWEVGFLEHFERGSWRRNDRLDFDCFYRSGDFIGTDKNDQKFLNVG